MLKLENITKDFDSDLFKKKFRALDDVSFELKAGKINGFLGANGAGKTTLLKIVMGFISPSNGRCEFQGLGIRDVGYLPERPYFYPSLTGREFCQYLSSLNNVTLKECESRIAELAPELRIDFALGRKISTYSKGMLQRLGFLCTLIHRPKLIILDEPLSGVDPIGRKELKDILLKANAEGVTVFFSSHIVSDLEEICENVYFLRQGKLIYEGAVDQVIRENIKPESTITFFRRDQLERLVVTEDEKQVKLQKLISEGAVIRNVVQDRPSLEEIFYQTKGQNE